MTAAQVAAADILMNLLKVRWDRDRDRDWDRDIVNGVEGGTD